MSGTGPALRILIADDQALHREMVRRAVSEALSPRPVEIVEAADGKEALAALQTGVEVAFLDVRMPGLTGLQVLAKIRDGPVHSTTPIVMVSSSMDPRDLDEAARYGVSAYVQKGRYPDFRVQVVDAMMKALKQDPASAVKP